MAFSLSNWFKGKPGSEESAPEGEKPVSKTTQTVPAGTPRVVAPPVVTQSIASVRKVVPNSVQPVSLRDPSARPPMQLPVATPPGGGGRMPSATPPGQQPPRKISFGNPAAAGAYPAMPEPAAPVPAAPAPMAAPDMTVSLEVGDFIDRVPPTLLANTAFDRQRRVEFHSSELYSDLTKGRASVPASIIYQKCPELFSRPVSETEDAEVPLPLAKLVEQMSQAFTTRADQVAEENVGEIETPFLQVAMEDNARLPKAVGSLAGPVRPAMPLPMAAPTSAELPPRPPHRTGQIQTISPLKTPVEPPSMQAAPTAQTAGPINPSKRPPSTVRASVAGGKIRLSGPAVPNRVSLTSPPASVPPLIAGVDDDLPPSATQRIASPISTVSSASAGSPSLQVTKKTARIQIPPISLRSPGSPSAPQRSPVAPPSVPVQPSPVTVRPHPGSEPVSPPPITFRSSPPPPSVKPMPHSFAPPPPRPTFPPPAFPVNPPAAAMAAPMPPVLAPAPAVADDRKITLGLAAVLRGLSSSLLAVEPSSIPEDVRVSLPFSLVEPQLSSGRVSVPREVFLQALPEGHQQVLDPGADLSEVPLPLQEVFQNLPSNALSIRADQVEEAVGTAYPTPFSQKAEEDAQRLGVGEVPVTPPMPEAVRAPEPEAAPALPMDRPLPVEEPAAEPVAQAAAPAVEEKSDDAPAVGLDAPIFVEETPAAPNRDIPLDLEGKAPALEEPPAAPVAEPVEAKAETPVPVDEPENKTPFGEASEATPAPEPTAGKSRPEPAAESFLAPSVAEAPAGNDSTDHTPEPTARTETPAAPAGLAPVPSETGGKWKDTELQVVFMTEEELDAKAVVKLVTQLPGITGCTVMFGDGLRLAGNFPEPGQAEGFSAMAPPFFKRTKNFAHEAQLGSLQAFTIYTDGDLYSFFMHDDICLSVRHTGRGFLPGVREKLAVVVRELARMYASAKPVDASDPVI